MIEVQGNLWNYWKAGAWLVVTTNGSVRKDGDAVMGRGIAKQAADYFPTLAPDLGQKIRHVGNHVFVFFDLRVLTMPVKYHWKQPASWGLIRQSIEQLVVVVNSLGINSVAMPRPGCGNGGLQWRDVRPLLATLNDRFRVVEIKDS